MVSSSHRHYERGALPVGKWVSGEPAEARGQGGGPSGESGAWGRQPGAVQKPPFPTRGCLITDLHPPDPGDLQAEAGGGQPQPCPKEGETRVQAGSPGVTSTLGPTPNPAEGQVTAVSNLKTGSE